MTEQQLKTLAVLEGLSGAKVAQLMTDFHGTDIIGEDFAEFIVDEGVCDRAEAGLPEEEDEGEGDGEDRYQELKADIEREERE